MKYVCLNVLCVLCNGMLNGIVVVWFVRLSVDVMLLLSVGSVVVDVIVVGFVVCLLFVFVVVFVDIGVVLWVRLCLIDFSSFCSVIGFLRKLSVLILVVLMVVLIVVCLDIMIMGIVSSFCVVYFLSSVMLLVLGI